MKTAVKRGLHPVFIALYPVLIIFASNRDQLDATMLLVPLLGILVLATVVWLLCMFLLRNAAKARVMTSLFLVAFFAYGRVYAPILGHLRNTWRGTSPNTTLAGDIHLLISALFFLFLLVAFRTIRRSAHSFAGLEQFATVFGSLLLMVPFALLATGVHTEVDRPTIDGLLGKRSDPAPDIYVLLFDGYPRADAVQAAYGFNNDSFLEELRRRDFQISMKARSNYAWTFLSLASFLNMRYLDDLAENPGRASNDRSAPFRWIRSNRVVSLLRQTGYKYVHMASTWNGTSYSDQADVTLDCGSFVGDDFQKILVETTWLSVFDSWLGRDLARCHLDNFRKVADTALIPGPKFVFAHFVPPHHPYLFDKSGTILREATVGDQFGDAVWDEAEPFVEQLMFVNGKILELIDSITERSATEPIIVIMSDHGVRPNHLSNQARMAVRFASLAAFRLPGEGVMMPDTITPVNIFPILFNRYLGGTFDILPNRSYFSAWTAPFDFVEVDVEADSILGAP